MLVEEGRDSDKVTEKEVCGRRPFVLHFQHTDTKVDTIGIPTDVAVEVSVLEDVAALSGWTYTKELEIRIVLIGPGFSRSPVHANDNVSYIFFYIRIRRPFWLENDAIISARTHTHTHTSTSFIRRVMDILHKCKVDWKCELVRVYIQSIC